MAQMQPWWKFWGESSPKQKIAASLETPALGGAGAVTKISYKIPGAIAGVVGGTALGALLFSGKDQKVEPTQVTAVDPTQRLDQMQRQLAQQRGMARLEDIMQRISQKTTTTTTTTPYVGGGSISGISGGSTATYAPQTITETYTQTGVSAEQFSGYIQALIQAQSQQAAPTQSVIVTPTQETTAAQMDLGMLALIGAGILAAVFLFKK
jgi:hypothetical protein